MTTLTFLLCNINTGHQLTYWWMVLTITVDAVLRERQRTK